MRAIGRQQGKRIGDSRRSVLKLWLLAVVGAVVFFGCAGSPPALANNALRVGTTGDCYRATWIPRSGRLSRKLRDEVGPGSVVTVIAEGVAPEGYRG